MSDWIAAALLVAGSGFCLVAGIGIVRLRDVFARMHAATKASALGLVLIGLAGLIGVDGGSAKVVLAVAFVLITTPSAAHLVGRAAYRAEGVELDLVGRDDLAELVDGEVRPEDDDTG
jgi:multicomponent Na+:H+ antiporter subunit G